MSNKIAGSKMLGLKKILGLKRIKCPRKIWPTKIINPKKLGPKILVEIGAVTAEILLIWTNVVREYISRTNVARKYVAWTNVSKIAAIG